MTPDFMLGLLAGIFVCVVIDLFLEWWFR